MNPNTSSASSSSSSFVIKIPSYEEVINNNHSQSKPQSLFNPSQSFTQAFSSIKNTEFYKPPPPAPLQDSPLRGSEEVTKKEVESSWVSSDKDEFNGWAFVDQTLALNKQNKGLPAFLLFGVGTSVVALLAVFAHYNLSRKGFVLRLSNPFHVVDNRSLSSEDTSKVDEVADEPVAENVKEVDVTTRVISQHKWEEGKLGRVVVPVSADATQQEALLWLKNLKIIDDEVKADELCTRREYARWLVLVNSKLERNPSRIVPSVALAGSTINAFDDVNGEDPDFEYIQALAEAGVVLSKLSSNNETSDLDSSESFFPERLISREDLIGWRAKLEYEVMPGLTEEILRNKIGFLDARELRSDVLPVLFIDTLANDKSIMRKVFGQVKRFQPGKPCTKAQAAVALTSGKMTELICDEFSKLEAENSSREFAMKEINSELLERGDIQWFWEKKIEDENSRYLEAEAAYLEVLKDLEHQKIEQDNVLAAYSKEKAALDCQKQLLSRLKEEVDEMNERLAYERANFVDEKHKIHSTVSELQVNYEKIIDSKSILEAELEALRILRSWIEDEAKKGQARTKFNEVDMVVDDENNLVDTEIQEVDGLIVDIDEEENLVATTDEGTLATFVEQLVTIKQEVQVQVPKPPSQKTGDVIEDIYAVEKPQQNDVNNLQRARNKGGRKGERRKSRREIALKVKTKQIRKCLCCGKKTNKHTKSTCPSNLKYVSKLARLVVVVAAAKQGTTTAAAIEQATTLQLLLNKERQLQLLLKKQRQLQLFFKKQLTLFEISYFV
uniref:S-layer homology domain-containing protein n=1 Tax=Tanacetum cinerariifolium TaxID=118510 RepID=A0A6L2MJK5_TANCI|nr:S-layer homology domain-containing protein [Tanacetum cinerariifolium]